MMVFFFWRGHSGTDSTRVQCSFTRSSYYLLFIILFFCFVFFSDLAPQSGRVHLIFYFFSLYFFPARQGSFGSAWSSSLVRMLYRIFNYLRYVMRCSRGLLYSTVSVPP